MALVGEVTNLGELVTLLGCRQSSLPMKYLGLPLGAKFNERTFWNPILEKWEQRLVGWKQLYLSKVGKVTLIKSTLSSLLLSFSLFPILVEVNNCIEKLQRNFLWSGIGEDHKFHQVNWDQIC